jgi:hypothetical protein
MIPRVQDFEPLRRYGHLWAAPAVQHMVMRVQILNSRYNRNFQRGT